MNEKLGNFISVENVKGKHGPVRNQFIIKTDRGAIFQSYDSIIAARINGKVFLDSRYWDYSNTTGKYRNIFLGESKEETQRNIRAGEYELVDLN
jgi:hypothetical protein